MQSEHGRLTMRRFAVLLSAVVVVLLGSGIVISRLPVAAQEATPTGMATMASHPVVGSWRWTNDPQDPFPYTYAIFHDDGTYQEVGGHDTAIGVWQPTGERTAEIASVFQDINPFSDAYEPGTLTVRATVEVNEAGDAATATYSGEVRAPDGALVFQSGQLEATLTRLTVASLGSQGTPVAATPLAQ
jgi:hypothetical protein